MEWFPSEAGPWLPALGAGLAYSVGSAFSIGPNNLMLLRAGLGDGRAGVTLGGVLVSYLGLLLMARLAAQELGGFGVAMRMAVSWAGFGVLLWFAGRSFWSATRGGAPALARAAGVETWRACLARVLTVVWLNPLTHIELLLVPAALCASFASATACTGYVCGLALGKAATCCAYCLCGRAMAPLVRRRWAMRIVEVVSGVVMARAAATIAVQQFALWLAG